MKASQQKTSPQNTGPALRLLAAVEQVIKAGGSIGDNLTDIGDESIRVRLAIGAPAARLIALAGDRLNTGDDLIGSTIQRMYRAGNKVTNRTPEPDEFFTDDFESWYLLGILVGLEMAGGAG